MARERESFTAGSGTASDIGVEREGVRDTIHSAEERVRETAREVKGQIEERSKEIKDEAERKAERWTTAMGEQIERVARALRTAGDALEDEGEGRMSAVSMSVAEQVERMGEYLRDENPGAMIRDLEQMARRNPGAFVGTTFVAGLLLGRFLRSSEPAEGDGAGERKSAESWTGGLETYEGRSEIERARVGSEPDRGSSSLEERTEGWEGDI